MGGEVENQHQPGSFSKSCVSRRKFLGQTAAAAAFSIVPRRVLGGAGHVAPSDKINIAFVGVGSQGLRVMLHFLRSEEHTSELQSLAYLVCRLLLEKKNNNEP